MTKILRLLACLLSAWTLALPSAAMATPSDPRVGSTAAQTRTADTGENRASGEPAVLHVATAASGPQTLHAAAVAGAPHQHGAADPPAFLLFAAVLVVVVFVSTRRRPDR